MNKQEVYQYLKENNIWHEITEHPAVYNMEELAQIPLPYPELVAKNLFVRDDKRREYYLITVKGEKRVNLKEFRNRYHTRPLTFTSPEEMMEIMGLSPGSVTPLGLLNDTQCRVQFYLDADFLQGSELIGVHPCDNTATVWMRAEDLIGILKEHGNAVTLAELQF